MRVGIRELWAERPALVTTLVIAPTAFVATLLVLFLVVGGSDRETPQQSSLADQPAQEQARTGARQTAVVQVQTPSDGDRQAQQSPASAASRQQAPSAQSAQPESDQQAAPSSQSATSSQSQPQSQQSQPQSSQQETPEFVAGHRVASLAEVLEESLDAAKLKYGSDGSEGGILPLGNGVVPSSRDQFRTTWDLIIPSAGIQSAIVVVTSTPSNAMGSPDNPYVIGWWNQSAPPGEVGNTLLAGHRDFEDVTGNIGTGVCWELVNTDVGDQMLVRDNGRNIYYVYTVTEALTLDPRASGSGRYLRQTQDPVLTLITCTGSFNADTHRYSHRLVVVGILTAVAAPDA